MADRSVQVVLRAMVTPYQAAMARATASTAALNTQVGRLTPGIGRMSGGLNQMGPGLDMSRRGISGMASDLTGLNPKLLGAGGIVFGLKKAFDASMAWESSLAGVAKTVEASDETIAALGRSLQQLSTEIPTSANELAGVAEAAGQLGIQTENIISFTETMAMLGETTNLSAQDAATTLARFANIVGTSQADFGRLGSVIVGLGNNFATTEREIAEMALRIAGAGRQVGMSEGEILAYATALSSVGIEAEAGGTAISRVFLEMQSAVMSGADTLDGFADIADMSVSEFVRMFEDDAAGAVQEFIEGLGRMSEEGGNTAGALEGLELGEIRVRDALLRTSSASGVLSDALGMQNDLWVEAMALQEEFDKRNATTEAGMQRAGNSLSRMMSDIGGFLKPGVDAAGNVVGSVADLVSDTINPSFDDEGNFISGAERARLDAEEAAKRSRGQAADADRLAGLAEHYAAIEAAAAAAEEEVDDFATAQDRAAAATRDALGALRDQSDHLSGMTDPLFRAIDSWGDYQDALAKVDEVRADTEASAEDLADAERDAYQAAIRSREGLAGLVDENGNVVFSTGEVIRAMSEMGLPPEVIRRFLADTQTMRSELEDLAGLNPEIVVNLRINRAELDALRAEFGNVATGRPGEGGRTAGTGVTSQETYTVPAGEPDHWGNVPRSHTGEGRVSGGLGWMPGLDDDERLRIVRLGESIQPAFRPADGMGGGGKSTSIGRQVTVGAGAIQLVVRDADDGMRAVAEKFDLMAGGFI